MRKFYIFFIAILLFQFSYSQAFEGNIVFLKQTSVDSLYYSYHVKGNNVRIDELDDENNISNSLLVDLTTNDIIALSPSRKLYMNVQAKPYVKADNSDFEIIKNKNNKKIIKGQECYQWRVKNKKLNTEISYWVTKDDFDFFDKLLKILNRSENSAVFFLQIEGTGGAFPMQSVERSLLRNEKMRLVVVKFEKTSLDKSIFTIPSDYINFER